MGSNVAFTLTVVVEHNQATKRRNWPLPITAYTIYFHLQHAVPTASEKDNMVIS